MSIVSFTSGSSTTHAKSRFVCFFTSASSTGSMRKRTDHKMRRTVVGLHRMSETMCRDNGSGDTDATLKI
eukprot:4889355-Pleurochrysis_carterae.AAC.1